MATGRYISLLFISIYFLKSVQGKATKNLTKIYIWNKNTKDFLSLNNQSMKHIYNLTKNHFLQEKLELEGKTVNVAVELRDPYLIYENNTRKLTGLLGDIWSICEDFLKFKSNLSFILDIDNITDRSQYHVVLSSEILHNSRHDIYNYSNPYYRPEYNIFQKVKIDLSSTYFLNCSEPKFWYASITVFIVFTASLWLTIVLLNKLCPNVVEPQLSIVTCLLIALTGLFNQGVSQELRTITTRAQFFVITTFGYTIYTALNAMLVRELATYSIEFLSNNDEIVRTLPICMPDNIIVYDRMLADNYTINGPGCPDISSIPSIQNSLCNYDSTLLESEAFLRRSMVDPNWKCNLTCTNNLWFESNALMFTGHFKEKKLIINFLEQLRSIGVLNKLILDWVRLGDIIAENGCNSKFEEVTFTHVKAIISAYSTAVISSSLMLFIEVVVHKLTKKTKIM